MVRGRLLIFEILRFDRLFFDDFFLAVLCFFTNGCRRPWHSAYTNLEGIEYLGVERRSFSRDMEVLVNNASRKFFTLTPKHIHSLKDASAEASFLR